MLSLPSILESMDNCYGLAKKYFKTTQSGLEKLRLFICCPSD